MSGLCRRVMCVVVVAVQVVVRMLNQFMNGISEKAKKNALDTVEPSLRVRIEEMLTSALAMLMQTACFHTTGDAAAQLQRRQLMQVCSPWYHLSSRPASSIAHTYTLTRSLPRRCLCFFPR